MRANESCAMGFEPPCPGDLGFSHYVLAEIPLAGSSKRPHRYRRSIVPASFSSATSVALT